MNSVKFFKCPKCGQVIYVASDSKVVPSCCGEPMKLLVANSTDAANEKHVPVIEHINGKLHVMVGSVEHPMTEAHHIDWIAIEQGDRIGICYLPRDGKPEAFFPEIKHGVAYAYCNLHGLWKAEF